MIKKRILIGVLLVLALLETMPLFSLAAPNPSQSAQEGTNLLKNPGFEGITCAPDSPEGWCDDNWTRDTFSGSTWSEIFTPQGWVTWWREGDGYGRPEALVIPKKDPYLGSPARIDSGNYGLKMFVRWLNLDAGYYQTVSGLDPGATVAFSVRAAGWSCDREDTNARSCGDPWNMTFQVGIDPSGGTDPFSPNIIWSNPMTSPDEFRRIGPVTAQVGDGGKVTAFMRGKTNWPYSHNDTYWDQARLVVTEPGATPTDTPLPAPPTATPGPSPTPLPTPTPRPDGAIVHIVQAGDTLFGIALRYDVPVDQIRELNASSLGPNDLIRVGQELVISLPSETPTPSPPPQPPTPTTAPVSPTPEGASICVLAFHDRNGDRVRDADEGLLPNAEFTLANASGVVAKHTTDGVSEPYCFTGLDPGNYRVIQGSPPGYEPSSSPEQNVALAEGTSFDFQFGNARSEEAATSEESDEPASTDEREGGSGGNLLLGGVLASVARIAGVLVLILAAVIAVLFVLARRRRY